MSGLEQSPAFHASPAATYHAVNPCPKARCQSSFTVPCEAGFPPRPYLATGKRVTQDEMAFSCTAGK